MPHLKIYQSLWAMEGLPGVDLDGDLPGAMGRILAAGFDGVGVNLARRPRARIAAGILAERGLSWEAQCFVRDERDLARWLDEAIAIGGAHHLNVQVASGPDTPQAAIRLMQRLLAVTHGSPLPVCFETHRGRLTNDLFLTALMLEACPRLRFTGDLSHWVTAHEMTLPLEPHLAGRIEAVLARTEALHLRVAGPNQAQVPLAAPQFADWRTMFEIWWRRGMEHWLARAGADDSLTVLCELGPPPYAVTDPEGRELTDRWAEALTLKATAQGIFAEALAVAGTPASSNPVAGAA
ncbi:hypothetical protein ACO2Q3_05560 [Caulobacter sp. KR2-114]|uniref:hypothetical protein n=1 Tax=Caulobacter sp. KR2-114 TaxID=3400912 RepID=UPI003BFC545F